MKAFRESLKKMQLKYTPTQNWVVLHSVCKSTPKFGGKPVTLENVIYSTIPGT